MEEEKKEIPINKYSIFELKAAVDKKIQEFLDDEDFEENQKYSNIKLLFGFLTVICTGTAYLYPKPFPENYYIILFSVIGYLIFSTIYWYIDKKLIDSIFFVGQNCDYCQKYRKTKPNKINEITFHSEIDDSHKNIYNLWFDFTFLDDKKTASSDKIKIDCTEIFDERGYLHKDKLTKIFKAIFKGELEKI